jgi:Right handed beta helix region
MISHKTPMLTAAGALLMLIAVTVICGLGAPAALAEPCLDTVRDRVLESALDKQGRVIPTVEEFVEINCTLTLRPEHVVTKRLVLTGEKASGVTINCNGATINGVHWLPDDTIVVGGEETQPGTWRGAENILVRDCNVHGSIRIHGVMVSTAKLRRMSYRPDHTQQMQAAGSKNITFDNLNITVYGRNPFYVASGSTRVTLSNSTMRGRSDVVPIYLDAETAENVIKDNDIGVQTSRREQIAIDGSARNLIVGNRLSGLNRGGIFLYRNCGERGVIRHQGPEDNVIIDNVFYYKRYRGDTPAVWIASRQNDLPGYCDCDALTPEPPQVPDTVADIFERKCGFRPSGEEAPDIGSNHDHLDHAHRTVVVRNRFVDREPSELIRVNDDPSYVFGNIRVDSGGNRNSPCYVANGYPDPILEHTESVALFDAGAGPRCNGRRLTCNDGVVTGRITPCETGLPRIRVEQAQCRVEGRNSGCSGRATCPQGTSLIAAKSACNLEFGQVSSAQLNRTPWSFAGVVRRSDNRADGVCRLGPTDISEDGAQLGTLRGSMDYSCRERDENGGDCHIRVALACQRSDILEQVQEP